MLLAIDIGNTTTALGIFDRRELRNSWRISSDGDRLSDEYGALLSFFLSFSGWTFSDIDGVIISSVVPAVLPNVERMCGRYLGLKPVMISNASPLGMRLLVKNPSEVGADRIVNAIGAFHEYGGPAIVLDFGTAITFDVVSAEGDYLGGAIAPGIGISMEALFSRAAKLPKVDLRQPPSAIGDDTITSIQSGFFYGFLGQTEEIIRRIRDDMAARGIAAPRVIATGGLSEIIANSSSLIQVYDPDLTLKGLSIAYERILENSHDER